MADLATEPRWSRIPGTFGEDAELAARHTGAYVRGFQGDFKKAVVTLEEGHSIDVTTGL